MRLWPGFYAMESSAWQRLESPWKQAGFTFETMSAVALLRALVYGQRLPSRVRVPGIDRALYQVYRLHEGQGERAASEQVRQVVQGFGQILYRHREQLLRQRPVVLFVLEHLRHGVYWEAGILDRRTGEPRELFRMEWFFPRCEVTQVDGEVICFSTF